MNSLTETFETGHQHFWAFIQQIEDRKLSEVSIRRALKKYDVKSLKISNVTPLRARKMYAAICEKYSHGVVTEKSWLQNERRLFIWCTLCYLHKNELEIAQLKLSDFEFLKQIFPNKEMSLIKFQIYSLVRKNSKSSGWLQQQDLLLVDLIRKMFGHQNDKNIQWTNVSKEFFIQSGELYFRNAKQCRERWLNYLDPNKKKGKWEKDQDIILLKEVLLKGKKWSKIVESLEWKKNQHMIKNRYKSLIHKKEKELRSSNKKQHDLIKLILQDYSCSPTQKQQQHHSESSKEWSESADSQFNDSDDNKKSQECVENMEEKEEKEEQEHAQQEIENKTSNFLKRCQNWPIIIQPVNKDIEKQRTMQRYANSSIEVFGNIQDKQFVHNLFVNVSSSNQIQENRHYPSIFEGRSPTIQGHFITNSPLFPQCWTPSAVFSEDHQIMPSPIGFTDFCSTARNFTNFMEKK